MIFTSPTNTVGSTTCDFDARISAAQLLAHRRTVGGRKREKKHWLAPGQVALPLDAAVSGLKVFRPRTFHILLLRMYVLRSIFYF